MGSGEAATGGGAAGSLASRLSELARDLDQEESPEGTLEHIVRSAIALVPGAEEASISLVVARRRVESRVPSGSLPTEVDAIQSETGEGPCLDAVFEQPTVHVPDVAAEERWPGFARRASQAGAGSMLSFRLFVDRDDLGALNLYARTPHAFDEESEQVGLVFSSHAAVAFSAARTQTTMRTALETRDVIGQAKGILMERYGISGEVAFSLLTRVSRDENRKLRAVCEELVFSRELAGQPRGGGTSA